MLHVCVLFSKHAQKLLLLTEFVLPEAVCVPCLGYMTCAYTLTASGEMVDGRG